MIVLQYRGRWRAQIYSRSSSDGHFLMLENLLRFPSAFFIPGCRSSARIQSARAAWASPGCKRHDHMSRPTLTDFAGDFFTAADSAPSLPPKSGRKVTAEGANPEAHGRGSIDIEVECRGNRILRSRWSIFRRANSRTIPPVRSGAAGGVMWTRPRHSGAVRTDRLAAG